MTTNPQTPDHEALLELCAAHALGALDKEDASRLEEHLKAGCDSCATEIDAHRRSMGALAALGEPRTPPASAEAALFDRIRADQGRPGPMPVPGPRLRWLPAAAAVLVLAALGVAVDSRLEVARLEARLSAFETTTDPIVTLTDLTPEDAAGGARARSTYDPRTATWRLFVHDLESPPPNTVYQGWLLDGGDAISIGTFLPDSTDHGFLTTEIRRPAGPINCLVSIEPAPGSQTPSGPSVFRTSSPPLDGR